MAMETALGKHLVSSSTAHLELPNRANNEIQPNLGKNM